MNVRFVGALLIVGAVAAGYFGKRYFDHAAAPASPVTVAPAAPPAAAEPAQPAPIARQPVPGALPDFQLKDREGRMRRLQEWRGRPLMVNYWATWCPPCRREIPLLNRLRASHAAQQVEVIGIAVDFREDVLAYAAREKIAYPLLIGEEDGLQAVAAVGMEPAFPFTVFADRQQRIVAVKVGELHEDEAQLVLAAIERIDAGSLALPAAKAQISEGLKGLAAKRALAEQSAGKG
jgi:thiol-disulfide isomerase/thioredoxin